MKKLHQYIHRERYANQKEVTAISNQAIQSISNQISYVSIWDTIKQQIRFLPWYTVLIQVTLLLFQLCLLQQTTIYQPIDYIIIICIICTMQMSFTYYFAFRSNVYGMNELEQVTRTGKNMLFFIKYVILGCFLYPVLVFLMFLSFLVMQLNFMKTALIVCVLYHLLSIWLLHSYGTGRFISSMKILKDGMIYIVVTILAACLLWNVSILSLSISAVISILLFYKYNHMVIRKEL